MKKLIISASTLFLFSVLSVDTYSQICFSKISHFKINKVNKTLRQKPIQLGELDWIYYYEKVCEINNNLITMSGYTVSEISDIKHKDLDMLVGIESNVLIVGCVESSQNIFKIKDTLAISDKTGYFEISFNINDYKMIGVIQRSNRLLYAYTVKQGQFSKKDDRVNQ